MSDKTTQERLDEYMASVPESDRHYRTAFLWLCLEIDELKKNSHPPVTFVSDSDGYLKVCDK